MSNKRYSNCMQTLTLFDLTRQSTTAQDCLCKPNWMHHFWNGMKLHGSFSNRTCLHKMFSRREKKTFILAHLLRYINYRTAPNRNQLKWKQFSEPAIAHRKYDVNAEKMKAETSSSPNACMSAVNVSWSVQFNPIPRRHIRNITWWSRTWVNIQKM